jgi:adenylosuccinate synthase
MPNAGHTYITLKKQKYITKVLPASFIGENIKQVMIGPGAVFSKSRLIQEMAWLRVDQVLRIHPNATILEDGHRETELENLTHIGSTQQGAAAAVIDKMMRIKKVTAKQRLKGTKLEHLVASHDEWVIRLEMASGILAEGSQGYSLGINTQFYPYTTSRDCGSAAFLSNLGIPIGMLDMVIGTCRTLPIRVGGTSGDCYADQEELSWEELDLEPERTTVTNRVRRIFTYSKMQIEEACWWCQPDLVFLNFANYVDKAYVTEIIAHIDAYSTVRWIGFGPGYHDIGLV